MADKDITGFNEFFEVWLPTRIKDSAEPTISQAENTLEQMQSIASSKLRSSLVPLITSVNAANAKVMNNLNEQVSISEGKVDALHNTVLDRLDTHLIPLETNLELNPAKLTVIPGQETLPGGGIEPKPMPGFPMGSINPVQPGPSGYPTIGSIENIPTSPPQQIEQIPPQQVDNCPPINCPPIPPCPEDMANFCYWFRQCNEIDENCVYMTSQGQMNVSSSDTLVSCNLLGANAAIGLYLYYKSKCHSLKKCPGALPAGQQILNIPPQFIPPGCCPPAVIQNIINPPGGGQIQNIPSPGSGMIVNIQPNPIVNEPLPTSPRPPIIGFGQIINDTVNLIAEKLKWRPTGDFAYATDQDNDESGFSTLWKEIGISPIESLQGKTLIQWGQDAIDNSNSKPKYQRRK